MQAIKLQGQMSAGLADSSFSKVLIHLMLPRLDSASLVAVQTTCHGLCDLLDSASYTPLWALAIRKLLPEPQPCSSDSKHNLDAVHQGCS